MLGVRHPWDRGKRRGRGRGGFCEYNTQTTCGVHLQNHLGKRQEERNEKKKGIEVEEKVRDSERVVNRPTDQPREGQTDR